ncbi:MAG: YceD family protein, partial [Pyramidobacter sp.]|nr:YceD family protein [Pyramidobacter sp.]
MVITERPESWKLIVPFPDEKEQQLRLSQSWTLDLSAPVEYGGQEFTLTAPLKVTAQTRRIPEGAELTLELDGEVATQCGKCLSPLTVAIKQKFMYSYVLQSEDAGKVSEEEFYESDKVVLPVKRLAASVDAGDLVWECLVVSLPAYVTCPDGCA